MSFKWNRIAAMIACLALMGAVGCSDDGGSSDDSNNGNNSGGNNASSHDGSSSFSAQVDTGSEVETYSGQQDDGAAGQSSWGATIAGEELHLTMMSSDGTVISVVVVTSEQDLAPGTFSVESFGSGTHVIMTSAQLGNSYESNGNGTITVSTCPRANGEHAKGSFNNVELASDSGNAIWTLDGDFDIVVYNKSGDLYCEQKSSNNSTTNNSTTNNSTTNNSTTNNSTTNNGGQCRADYCMEEGVCCPYVNCISQCEQDCILEDTDCAGGADPAACDSCVRGCWDDVCEVSSECRTAYVDLVTCEQDNNCDTIDDEDQYQECLEGNCCTELNDAL
jgi:hypothetical protein